MTTIGSLGSYPTKENQRFSAENTMLYRIPQRAFLGFPKRSNASYTKPAPGTPKHGTAEYESAEFKTEAENLLKLSQRFYHPADELQELGPGSWRGAFLVMA